MTWDAAWNEVGVHVHVHAHVSWEVEHVDVVLDEDERVHAVHVHGQGHVVVLNEDERVVHVLHVHVDFHDETTWVVGHVHVVAPCPCL